MSGVQGHVLGHLVRRGVHAAQAHFQGPTIDTMDQLQYDANLYEQQGPNMEIKPQEMLPVMITAFIAILLIASIRYTVGEVIASLAMIESPTTTAIIEDKPPAYADEPDAPLEKEPLMPAEAEADVEVLLVKNKPITAKITATVGHLTRVGGFRARWRGLGVSILYHFAHNASTNLIAGLLGFGLAGHALVYIFTTVALARLHMAWTHTMIAGPNNKRFWSRMVPRKQCKALLLPSLAFALAQQLTLHIGVAMAGAFEENHVPQADIRVQCGMVALKVLAVIVTVLSVAIGILLPATVTLTRIEAALLPEGEETIVPFDRQALIGDIDITARGGCRALFVQAWRSFDRAARWRLIKLYVKMALIQFTVGIVAVHLMAAELYLIAGDRIAVLVKSGVAQLQLAAIEAKQNAN